MTAPTIDRMLTEWVANGELPDIPGGWTIPRFAEHVRREALREARDAVAAVPGEDDGNPFDGTRVVIGREDALAAIGALLGGSPA